MKKKHICIYIYIYTFICMKNIHIIKNIYTYEEGIHNKENIHVIINNIYACEGYLHNKEYIHM